MEPCWSLRLLCSSCKVHPPLAAVNELLLDRIISLRDAEADGAPECVAVWRRVPHPRAFAPQHLPVVDQRRGVPAVSEDDGRRRHARCDDRTMERSVRFFLFSSSCPALPPTRAFRSSFAGADEGEPVVVAEEPVVGVWEEERGVGERGRAPTMR